MGVDTSTDHERKQHKKFAHNYYGDRHDTSDNDMMQRRSIVIGVVGTVYENLARFGYQRRMLLFSRLER